MNDQVASSWRRSVRRWPLAAFVRSVLLLLPLALMLPQVLGLAGYEVIERIEQRIYDRRLRWFDSTQQRDERIVIIDIDEASLKQYGRWPWRRQVLARLNTELLQRQQVALLGFDVLFSEPEDDTHAEIRQWLHDNLPQQQVQAERLQQLDALMRNDSQLIDSVRGQRVVLGYYFSSNRDSGRTGTLPTPLPVQATARISRPEATKDASQAVHQAGLQAAKQEAGRPFARPRRVVGPPLMEGYTANLPELAAAAPAGGFMNALTDSDGSLRSVPLLAQLNDETTLPAGSSVASSAGGGIEGRPVAVDANSSSNAASATLASGGSRYYPSLSLAMFLALLGPTEVQLAPVAGWSRAGQAQLGGLDVRQGKHVLHIPTDIHGAVLVPFRSKGGKGEQGAGRFAYISAADVLSGRLQAQQLKGKIALLGTSAPGLRDLRVTPVNPNYPGVEVHATLLSAMLDGRFIYVPDYARGYALVMVLLASLVLLVLLPRTGATGAWVVCLGLMLLMVGINAWAYVQAHVALPLAASLVTVMLTYVLHVSYGLFLETRTKKQLASLFGHYVPAELVSEMVKRPGAYTTAVQSRELTILFCDIRQFTHMAEAMEPQQVQALLNRLFNRIAAIIAANHGTIDKYIGDCVMAFWGAPLPVADHAWLAVKTVADIGEMLRDFNAEQASLGLPPIQLNIGINSGVVSVGDMGSSIRRSYTVLGDAVNVAARLEPLAKHYDAALVAGERTAELAPQVQWQWLDTVRVQGRAHALQVYAPFNAQQPAAELDAGQQREAALWQQFRQAYQNRAWHEGLQLLQSLQALRPGKRLYTLYQERLHVFMDQAPPHDWDGVTETAK
ncbi:MAG: adenylate/guanylate cyclase domain-containing protein [Brachymonas sp.]|nr:adenylate/guanylate cyclase domain-containing protein [Brachymonas sp.]